jgi:acyl carrier protein
MPEIMQKVQSAFQEAFSVDPSLITMEATPNQIPGWDSLGHASLAATLEQVFNVSLDIDDLMAMEDVRSVVEVLQRKLQ